MRSSGHSATKRGAHRSMAGLHLGPASPAGAGSLVKLEARHQPLPVVRLGPASPQASPQAAPGISSADKHAEGQTKAAADRSPQLGRNSPEENSPRLRISGRRLHCCAYDSRAMTEPHRWDLFNLSTSVGPGAASLPRRLDTLEAVLALGRLPVTGSSMATSTTYLTSVQPARLLAAAPT